MSATFAIGQRVRTVRAVGSFPHPVGSVGVVDYADGPEGSFPYRVRFADGKPAEYFNADELEALPAELEPRMVAVLVALRRGPLAGHVIRDCIADEHFPDTRQLTDDMRAAGLIGKHLGACYLAPAGAAWLNAHGLTAAPHALLISVEGSQP